MSNRITNKYKQNKVSKIRVDKVINQNDTRYIKDGDIILNKLLFCYYKYKQIQKKYNLFDL